MSIRRATEADVPRMMEIFEGARAFQVATGNPRQWEPRKWPPEELLRQDIAAGKSYVCELDGRVVATFFYDFGEDVEPTYAQVEGGSWRDPSPYGVVHRIASDRSTKGIGRFCIQWAYDQCGHLRMDTHGDNKVMQHLLTSMGFDYRGIIYVVEDNDPRLAYEW